MTLETPTPELPQEARDVTCTHCESADVALVSLFGGSVSECLFRCNACSSFFHWVKWR
jgi:hypothetical protein